ncbi:hypothetical protein AmDm5_1878 [Acetobacter malorum]|uniref:Pectate lyase superfamily protein n=1 Tax=Acetobacter malorum TaxID=178901 RepID=A0A087PKH3_9PROT|nr:glycosyl hydrolase family 28-related protein [Acetobacter malorum]KFL87876.1 hypothetical protein AmDm5_1878 [Acetobacter malorum]OAG75986.1 Pectate lyase superfamily protein [Acetobacter malorum]
MADTTPSTPYGAPYFSSVKADNIDPESNIGSGPDAMPLKGVVKQVTGAVQSAGGNASKTMALPLIATNPRALDVIFSDVVNALDFGVTTDSADNAAGLQAAINAAVNSGKCLYIPSGVYKYTPPLVIPGPLHITGDGCLPLFGSLYQDAISDAINIPMVDPYFSGTVLRPSSNGQSAFVCSAAGISVSGDNFGVSFQTPFTGTGHMLDFQPADASNGKADMGLMGATWRNVGLYGHDGDHYMFNLVNPLYNTFDSCKAFGGGFSHLHATINGGNSLFMRTLSMVIVGGAAHGYAFSTKDNGQAMQLITMLGVQCITDSQPHDAGIAPSPPTNAQSLIHCDPNCHQFAIVAPDLETTVSSFSVFPPDSTFVDRVSGGLSTGITYAGSGSPSFAKDFLQGGAEFQCGVVAATETTGTVTFPDAYYHSTPVVNLEGYGVDAKLSAAPEWNQFSYELSAPGSFGWTAVGR